MLKAQRVSRAVFALGSSMTAMVLAATAQAQVAEADSADVGVSGSQADAIVVTARRRGEDVQDVPAVVQAVSGDDIEKLNIRQMEDLSTVVPGLQLQGNTNGIGSVTTVRGVDFNVVASGDNGTVQYYYNDAPVSSGVLLQALYDIGQIEVLRGPQGTLKGRSSPSGAISVTFRRPDVYEVGGYAQATGNDLGGYNFNGAMNIPVVEGLAALRIAGLVSDGTGNRVLPRSGASLDDLKDETESLRVSGRITPFDGILTVDASYMALDTHRIQYSQVQSGSELGSSTSQTYPGQIISAEDRLSANYLPNDVEQHFKNYNASAQLALFGQQLNYVFNRLESAFTSLDPQLTGDAAGLFTNPYAQQLVVNPLTQTPSPTGRLVPLQQVTDAGAVNTSHEVRLQNEDRVAGIFDYVAGFLSFKQRSDTSFAQIAGIVPAVNPATGLFASSPAAALFLPLQRINDSLERSVYGNVTAHLGMGFELSGGIRHIWYQTDGAVNLCTDLTYSMCVPNPSLTTSLDDEATIYQLTAKYEVSNNVNVYASYGTSWRPDATLVGGPSFPTARQAMLSNTPPETSKNYEVGLKSRLFDNRVLFNLTGYYQKFENYPYRAPGGGVFGIRYGQPGSAATVEDDNYLSAVPVEVKGIEAEIGFDILQNWNIAATFSYADGKIKDGQIACLDLDGDGVPDGVGAGRPTVGQIEASLGGDGNPATADTPGVALCNVTQRSASNSPFSASVTSEYTQPLSDGIDGVARLLYSFRGNSIGDPTNPNDSVDSHGLLNLYAGLRDPDGAWEILAYAKNVFDTFRVLTRETGAAATQITGVGAFAGTNYYNITSTAPREFGVTARMSFGSR
jgi:iron complex outermembrane recepter protein